MKFNVRALAIVALLAFVTGALFIAACGDDDDTGDAQAQVDQSALDAVQLQVTKTAILAAATAIRLEELHDLDESLSAATEIDESWEGRATRMRWAVASVTWPNEMKDMAATTLEELTGLEEALADGNLNDAKTLATESHDAWHDLEHDAMPFVAGEEVEDHGAEASGDAGHAEEENDPNATGQ